MTGKILNNERELLLRIAKGDAEAFKELYRHYLNDAYSLAISFLHIPQAAEDIVQELFIKLWIKRNTLSSIEQFGPYMLVSMRNMLINELEKMRNRDKYEQLSRSMLTAQATPAEKAEATNLQMLVTKALGELPLQQQQIYRLSREQGMDIAAISQQLQLAPKTVSNILSLVLNHVRSFLHEYGYVLVILLLSF